MKLVISIARNRHLNTFFPMKHDGHFYIFTLMPLISFVNNINAISKKLLMTLMGYINDIND